MTTHIQQGIIRHKLSEEDESMSFSLLGGTSMENKFPFPSPRKKHCFRMNLPPLVTEGKNCRSKSGPKVSKELSEKSLKFAGKWASQVARVVKNSPANAGNLRDPGSIPGSGRSPGEEPMATQYSAWNIHGKEEPGGLHSTACRVRRD